ncbi:MAG: site-specific DNA-methyltransferase [Zetaproteobacteria bacterium CG_4_10_14_3_um_filter_54_28]|nr:MAG: site-specific DNA-methyltransferase [Zetaproteobacteria bacterium CG_4_10_14_3_um_filter_54_28]
MADNYDHYSKEELLRLIRERDRKPKFGLVWERDEIEHDKSLNSDFVALDLDPSLSCGDAPYENLIIEGDNFDALRYLRMTHAGQVKCIYIDPPYNTGNRDFIYNDRFVDKDDAYRHSKWLEFMYRRLTLAKDLLADDAVIFVSIDDNEMLHLGMLMDQVFGESNRVATCIWQKRYMSANDHKTIAPMHEYVLVYQASSAWRRNMLPRGEEKDRQYRLNDEKGLFRPDNYTCNKNADERPNLYYPITQPNTGEEIWPKRTRVWSYSKDEHLRHISENMIYWGKDGKGKVPAFKRYKHLLKNADGVVPNTWWTFDEVGHTDSAKKELLEILHEQSQAFSTPKPTGLIERILRIATKPGDLVLDFFAGSGTTAQAVMKLNAEDGGKRRFILVSSTEATDEAPDKNLCRDVCAERVRRVAQGYTSKKGEAVEGLGGSFAYLHTKRIPVSRVFNDIQHEQVWRALQLIHRVPLTGYEKKAPVQLAGNADDRLMYVPKLSEAILEEVARLAGLGGRLVVYSWQPGQVRQRISGPNVAFERIPEFLVSRFGGGK